MSGGQRPEWFNHAACRGVDTAIFFPDTNGPGAPTNAAIAAARVVCDSCPVRSECLNYALTNREHDGVWGGTSPSERRRGRRGWARTVDQPCQQCGRPLPEERRMVAIYCSPACRSTANTRRSRRRAG